MSTSSTLFEYTNPPGNIHIGDLDHFSEQRLTASPKKEAMKAKEYPCASFYLMSMSQSQQH